MRRILRLAAFFFFAVAIGCSSATAKHGDRGAPLSAEDAAGVWTLSDDENAAFDVRLSAKGTAVSNWSKGSVGARGEHGHWAIVDGAIVIDYDDGWRDIVFRNARGSLRKKSYSPDMPRDGPPRDETIALRTLKETAPWVGVYEVAAAGSRTGATHFIAIQSTGLAWNTADDVRVGAWWMAGEAMRIRWANGWLDEFRAAADGYEVRSWRSAAAFDAVGNPSEPPAYAAKAMRSE